jgi:hypothetical protein
MESDDLTILFLTLNKLPAKWTAYHKSALFEAATNHPIITISREPMWGINLIQEGPFGVDNIYRQMLRGAELAETPYVAIAEDDVLYTREHFAYRPPLDTFAYNLSRWSLYTWEPVYNYRGRRGNFALVAPRLLLIESLKERFAKYPGGIPEGRNGELGRPRVEARLGVTERKAVDFYTEDPIVVFHHDFEIDPVARRHRKAPGILKAYDIPHWGRADELVKHFV